MKSTKKMQSTQSIRREAQDLEVRYGRIGISAVVAAMRYQGAPERADHVATDLQPDRWLQEMVPDIAA